MAAWVDGAGWEEPCVRLRGSLLLFLLSPHYLKAFVQNHPSQWVYCSFKTARWRKRRADKSSHVPQHLAWPGTRQTQHSEAPQAGPTPQGQHSARHTEGKESCRNQLSRQSLTWERKIQNIIPLKNFLNYIKKLLGEVTAPEPCVHMEVRRQTAGVSSLLHSVGLRDQTPALTEPLTHWAIRQAYVILLNLQWDP